MTYSNTCGKDKFQSIRGIPIYKSRQLGSLSETHLIKVSRANVMNIRMGIQIKTEKFFHFIKIILTFVCITITAFLVNSHLSSLLTPIQYLKDAHSAHYNWIPTHYLTAQIVSYGYLPESVPQYTNDSYSLLLSNLDIIKRMAYKSSNS